ncbi:unnamed protein product [Rotaria sordida]|uniref:Uncharacterized protein n=1 Tax=Rotaria sordida TaxID=392033 RepID=A0A816DWR1_9BILA|nr:unnamed protein product [Rotaria sordida]CAF1640060.1 unnamed protein product [Rotaria sordida]
MIITAFICWLIFVDMIYCLDVIVTPPSIACTINTRRICDLYNEIARLIVLVFIPILTLDIEKNPLRLRIEILSGEVTFLMTTFQSSLSFYIYATMGGTLFRQTFKKLL